ncbi:MAG: transglutaminase-like domain-containing protein [Bacteroidales bacterium]|nr:transglutaminase-like domain-containing protein [Bacteroidales bacterium]
MTEKETNALIRLLDDPDKTVYRAIRKKILSEGANILPDLTKAWQEAKANGNDNRLLMSRFESLVPMLQNNLIVGLIEQWQQNPNDLRQIAWLVSRLNNFALDRQVFDDGLDNLKDMLPTYQPNNFTPLEQVRIFNNVFFNKMGFKPVKNNDYYNPLNCIPYKVMTNKIGNPVSLALIYMMLAVETGLPICGVNLPKNFILTYVDEQQKSSFYINPMSMGAVFEKSEIDRFLQDIKLKPEHQFYDPCDIITIAKRLLCRLELSYRTRNDARNSDLALRALNTLGDPLNKVIDWE